MAYPKAVIVSAELKPLMRCQGSTWLSIRLQSLYYREWTACGGSKVDGHIPEYELLMLSDQYTKVWKHISGCIDGFER